MSGVQVDSNLTRAHGQLVLRDVALRYVWQVGCRSAAIRPQRSDHTPSFSRPHARRRREGPRRSSRSSPDDPEEHEPGEIAGRSQKAAR
jgi:hypothetical protein